MRFLIVDDEPDDRKLAIKYLKEEFPDAEFIEIFTQKQFYDAIQQEFDVVITDYHLHWTNGIKILMEVRTRKPFVPVIMLTGTGTEEVAVEAMKRGLDDYVIKTPQRFIRLPAAVKAAMEKEALKRKERMLSSIIENAKEAVVSVDNEGRIIYVNKATEEIFGWKAEELIGKHMSVMAVDAEEQKKKFEEAMKKGWARFETIRKDKYGNEVPVLMTVIPFKDEHGNIIFSSAIIVDIRELKEYENKIRHLNELLRAIRSVNQLITKEKDEKKLLQKACNILIKVKGYKGVCIVYEGNIFKAGDYEPLLNFIKEKKIEEIEKEYIIEKLNGNYLFAINVSKEDVNISFFIAYSKPFDDEEIGLIKEVCGDIIFALYSIKIERALKEEEELMKAILTTSPVGIGYTVNRILGWANETMYKMTGYTPEETIGKSSRILYESDEEYERVGREIERAIKKGKVAKIETRWKRKDGSLFDCMLYVYPINPKKPEEGFVVTAVDITERKKLEEALKESEEKYRVLAEQSTDGIFLAIGYKPVYVNPAFLKIIGAKSIEEIKDKDMLEFLYPEDRERIKKDIEKALAKKLSMKNYELRLRRLDGKEIFVELTMNKVIYKEQPHALGIVRDITEKKKMEEALKESEEKYRSLVERANDGICIIQDGIIKFVNKKILEMGGYLEKEIIGKSFHEFIAEESLEKVTDRYKRRMAGEKVEDIYEVILKKKDGSKLWAELNVSIINYEGKPAELVIVRDITERKRLIEALKESEEKYRILADNAPAGVFIVRDNEVIYINKVAEEMLEREKDAKEIYQTWKKEGKIKINDFLLLWDEEKRKKLIEILERGMEGETSSVELITGEKRNLLFTITVIKYKGKRALLGIVQDITEIREAQKKIEESERKFRSLVTNAYDAIYIITPEGFQYVNPAFERLTGYSKEEVLSKDFDFRKLVHPDDLNLIIEREEARKRGRRIPSRYEFRIVRKDGSIRVVEASTVDIGMEGEARVMGILRDVTERRKAEEEIRKLSSLHRAIGMSINESESIQQLCNSLLEGIKKIIDVEYASIFIYDKEENKLIPSSYVGYPQEIAEKMLKEYIVEEGQPWEAVRVFMSKKESYVKNVQKYEPLSFNRELYKKYDIKELYTLPLIVRGEIRGVMQVAATTKNPLLPEKRRLLKNIAEEIAAGMAKIDAEERMRKALEREREFKLRTAHYFFNPICIAKGFLELALEEGDGKDKILKAIDAINRVEKVIKNITERGEIRE